MRKSWLTQSSDCARRAFGTPRAVWPKLILPLLVGVAQPAWAAGEQALDETYIGRASVIRGAVSQGPEKLALALAVGRKAVGSLTRKPKGEGTWIDSLVIDVQDPKRKGLSPAERESVHLIGEELILSAALAPDQAAKVNAALLGTLKALKGSAVKVGSYSFRFALTPSKPAPSFDPDPPLPSMHFEASSERLPGGNAGPARTAIFKRLMLYGARPGPAGDLRLVRTFPGITMKLALYQRKARAGKVEDTLSITFDRSKKVGSLGPQMVQEFQGWQTCFYISEGFDSPEAIKVAATLANTSFTQNSTESAFADLGPTSLEVQTAVSQTSKVLRMTVVRAPGQGYAGVPSLPGLPRIGEGFEVVAPRPTIKVDSSHTDREVAAKAPWFIQTSDMLGLLESSRRWVSQSPRNWQAWKHRGNAAVYLSRDDEAAEAFGRAVALRPADLQSWIDLGMAESRLGHRDKSAVAFREAYRLAPHDVGIRRNLESLGVKVAK